MTSTPVKRLGSEKRGYIGLHFYADVILFHPGQFRDNSTYENPKELSTGLDWVFVNETHILR
jgi:N-acyl-D-aspartate/D-glutamate deacylase